MNAPPSPSPRKTYSRRADVPPDVLAALNQGLDESRTLAEWLSVDTLALLAAVLPAVGLKTKAPAIIERAGPFAPLGVMARIRGVGGLLREAAQGSAGTTVFARLSRHRSDTARSWAAAMLEADPALDLAQRIEPARIFAMDPNMGVREMAWMAFRPTLAGDLKRGIDLLLPWTADSHEGVRRCAVEATRPRGVWTSHIEPLKRDPSPGLPILEAVKADPSRYVQKATGNWINDASKTRPDWAEALIARWRRESTGAATQWIARHGERGMRKKSEG